MEWILSEIEEGVHIVNEKGVTVVYNDAMENIEGLNKKRVVGKHLLEAFPSWTRDNSTLLTAIAKGELISNEYQTYLNLKGKKIRTRNTTYPIYRSNMLVGAVEIAKDLTAVSHMSEEIVHLRQQLIQPKKTIKKEKRYYVFDDIICRDRGMKKAVQIGKRAAQTLSCVMLVGETGTGKELFAQSIHSCGKRADNPFIGQNCAAIPESLLEALLFGTTKGSFTGAQDRPGLFEQADGGTLFLDEINSMSLPLQAKLLRVLQENYVRRIGGQKDIPIDVRIVAASSEDPRRLVEKNLFRKDLFYRINVIHIVLPPLRKRPGDILLLVEHFINHYNNILKKDIWGLTEEMRDAFQNYTWPGNVRELQNFIESAMNMVFSEKEHIIAKEHMPNHVEELLTQREKSEHTLEYKDISNLPAYLEEVESQIIAYHYDRSSGNITKAAKALGISRQRLQHRLKKHGILNEI